MRAKWIRVAAGVLRAGPHGIGMRRLARAELASAARCPGPRSRRVHHPGADARRGQHRTELARSGRRRHGRQRDQDRAAGLARVGDHGAQRRRRAARQRDGQAGPDQPAGFTAHRTGAADGRAAAGQAARRLADPVVVGEQLPEHRADTGRDLAAAQRRWDRPCSGHHRGVQHRLGRPRGRPAQPDRAARHVHRAT